MNHLQIGEAAQYAQMDNYWLFWQWFLRDVDFRWMVRTLPQGLWISGLVRIMVSYLTAQLILKASRRSECLNKQPMTLTSQSKESSTMTRLLSIQAMADGLLLEASQLTTSKYLTPNKAQSVFQTATSEWLQFTQTEDAVGTIWEMNSCWSKLSSLFESVRYNYLNSLLIKDN